MRAMAKANQIRFAMATFKRETRALDRKEAYGLLAAHLEAAELLPEIGAFKLRDYLAAPHRVGPTKAAAMLRAAGIQPHRGVYRVRNLTLGERARLAAVLRGMGK
jgi:hypothetical protein